jgi:hypothetical protein
LAQPHGLESLLASVLPVHTSPLKSIV